MSYYEKNIPLISSFTDERRLNLTSSKSHMCVCVCVCVYIHIYIYIYIYMIYLPHHFFSKQVTALTKHIIGL